MIHSILKILKRIIKTNLPPSLKLEKKSLKPCKKIYTDVISTEEELTMLYLHFDWVLRLKKFNNWNKIQYNTNTNDISTSKEKERERGVKLKRKKWCTIQCSPPADCCPDCSWAIESLDQLGWKRLLRSSAPTSDLKPPYQLSHDTECHIHAFFKHLQSLPSLWAVHSSA